ncbi:hypothetical protein LOC67_00715 [Stieleria sp. JC731]|uniref:calcium-binding protein n=1 Tax=Pirellulaceae TaxID=2691357 RepID=UPI001E5F9754|nr:calcium-binding protein [Stieleria sp. JC731]MCC9599063.1 hypothetical protein [Stieleria sp. JC731]
MRCTRILAAFSICLAILAGNARADVDYDIEDYCHEEDGWVQIFLDDSHDLVMISRDDDELVIRGLMFDQNEFADVPDLFAFTEDELEDMADEDFKYDNEFDDIQKVFILCRDGNDVVLCDPDVPVEIYVFGEEGNDYIEGSMLGDNLQGGPGRDKLFGRGGADVLHGGPDGEKDRLEGGEGTDTFIQYYKYQTVTLNSFQPYQFYNPLMLRGVTSSRTAIRQTQTTRVDEETLADFDTNEDVLIETQN